MAGDAGRRQKSMRSDPAVIVELLDQEEEESPVQRLPDPLLSCVLSTLGSSQDVAAASMVCRRWHACASHVQHLSFRHICAKQPPPASGWIRLIQRSPDLRKLCISSSCDPPARPDLSPSRLDMTNYILMCLACANSGLEILHLDLSLSHSSPDTLNMAAGLQNLTELHLYSSQGVFEFLPTGDHQFKALKKCKLSGALWMEDLQIEEFLNQCPIIEDLSVSSCPGLERPTLASNSLRKLEFIGGMSDRLLLRINAHQLASLVLMYVDRVAYDSDNLEELHLKSGMDPCFEHLPRLQKLSIEGVRWSQNTVIRVLEQCSNATYVSVSCDCKAMWELMPAHKLFYNISQVETLEIGCSLSHMYWLAASSAILSFPRLRRLYFHLDYWDDAVLKFILDNSPQIKHVVFLFTWGYHILSQEYFRRLLDLQGTYPDVAFDLRQECSKADKGCTCCTGSAKQTINI